MIFCPKITINSKIAPRPMQYAARYSMPDANDAGNNTATIRAYVGLQLLKTGPNAAPNRISFFIPDFCCDLDMFLFAIKCRFVASRNRSQSTGKRMLMPNNTMMPPDNVDQTVVGMFKRAVVDRRSRVNSAIESIRLPIITNGRLIVVVLFFGTGALAPTTTGINGSMHGARTVSTPAKNENMISSITVIMPL